MYKSYLAKDDEIISGDFHTPNFIVGAGHFHRKKDWPLVTNITIGDICYDINEFRGNFSSSPEFLKDNSDHAVFEMGVVTQSPKTKKEFFDIVCSVECLIFE